jgi:general secretion pathway protein D
MAGTLSAATIGIVPSTTTVLPGASFTLDVDITDISDLYAFQFDVGFAPDILSATAVTDGAFLDTGFFPGFIDNTAGTISFAADSLAGPVPGVSGSGTLATIEFLALAQGMSPVTLSNVILLNSTLADIPVTTASGSVSVIIPEPSSALLLTVGLLAIGTRVRRSTPAKR